MIWPLKGLYLKLEPEDLQRAYPSTSITRYQRTYVNMYNIEWKKNQHSSYIQLYYCLVSALILW